MMRRAIAILALCSAAMLCQTARAVDAEAVATRFASMYFAPMDGGAFWRMFDPETGMIEFRNTADGRILRGAAGWSAIRDGGVVTVSAPVEDGQPRLDFTFRKGKPEVFSFNGTKYGVQVEDGEVKYSGSIPAMWDDDPSQEEDPQAAKWGGRFTLFYKNPNLFAALVSSFALAALAAFMFCTKLRVVSGVVTAALLVALVMAGSRGAEVGFALGTAVMLFAWFLRRGVAKSRLFVVYGVGLLIAVAVMVLTGKAGEWLGDYGNVLRFEVWGTAPTMMADAPGGWCGFMRAADAFMNWYQDLDHHDYLWTLVSAHLTAMVAMGWIGRFLWVFGWFAVICLFARSALRGFSPLPCAIWISLFVAAVFNPVLYDVAMWVPPVAVLAWWLESERPWKSAAQYAIPLAGSAVAALLVVLALYVCGTSNEKDCPISVQLSDRCVAVNGDNPKVWVLDDGKCLGWQRAPREIRFFCKSVKDVPAIGYAMELERLPRSMSRLIVAGSQCREYINAWIANEAPSVKELVFLSPDFPPSFVPEGLRRESSLFMVLGEFAARYVDVYGEEPLPEWVGVSPGAETYIPGWVSFVM